MQFVPSKTGYDIKEVAKLKSPQKLLEFDGDATFSWENKNLQGIDKDTIDKYFALAGQEFFALYKKTFKIWEKFAITQLAHAEKLILKKKDDEMKALKKMGSGDAKVIEASQKRVKEEADKQATAANKAIKEKFQSLLPDLSKKAHDTVVKKLGKAAGALKKNHGKAVFKAVMFAVAVAAVVLAAVALGPIGGIALGIGIAAVTIKAIGVLSKGIKDLRGYIKEWNKVSEKASAEIDNASVAVAKAVQAMDACNSVRESLVLKIAGARAELDKASKGLAGSDKKVVDLKKQIAASEKDLQDLEKFIGDNTNELLGYLREAAKQVDTAKKKKPKKVIDNLDKVMDLVEKVGTLAT